MKHIVEVIFNTHFLPDVGVNWEAFRVGDEYNSYIPPATIRTCIGIEHVKDDDGNSCVDIEFNDGTYDRIYKFDKITLADEKIYSRIVGEKIMNLKKDKS